MLAGIALGVVTFCVTLGFAPRPFLESAAPFLFQSNAMLLSLWSWLPFVGIVGGLGYALLLNVILIPARRRWLAAALTVMVMVVALQPGPPASVVRYAILLGFGAFTLLRFGALAIIVQTYTLFAIRQFPLTTNWAAWYAQSALIILLTLVGLALYGFVTTVKRRYPNPAHP